MSTTPVSTALPSNADGRTTWRPRSSRTAGSSSPTRCTPEWVAEARADFLRILETTPFGRDDFEGRKTRRVYALFGKTRTFDAPATHPLVLAVLDRVLGHYQLSAPTGIEIGPGERAQPLHPDDAIYPLARPARRGRRQRDVAAVRLHRRERRHRARARKPQVDARRPGPRPSQRRHADDHDGDAGRIGAALPRQRVARRRREPHRSAAPRRGVALRGVVAAARSRTTCSSCRPRSRATLPERLQELLGYNIHPPFIGYVDGRHPRKLLGNDEQSTSRRCEPAQRREHPAVHVAVPVVAERVELVADRALLVARADLVVGRDDRRVHVAGAQQREIRRRAARWPRSHRRR